jgi:hypothetical protein
MFQHIRGWMRDPVFLLGLAAGLIAFVVQSGDLDSVDTARRLQTTHSFWTAVPPVLPGDYPDFGLRGRGGRIYAWYGIGQSLLMLPADVVGTDLEKLPIFDDYNGNDPGVRNMVVSYSTNILVNVVTALVCFQFLTLLRFTKPQAIAGVLALLLCTTHLHYTQNMMENNYILLLTMAGFTYQYEWLLTGERRALLMGSAAFGLNLLTRLTVVMDLLAGGTFLLLVLVFARKPAVSIWQRVRTYMGIALPVYAGFLLIDRLYQYYRFGSFLNTYVSVFAQQQRLLNPSLPENYPFETPFRVGFLGALFAPEKSIFLFDPLLGLTILVVLVGWKRFRPEAKAYVVSGVLLLLAYISFYARYTVWSGDSAWGDRYVSTAAQMVAFLSVPLLLRYRADFGRGLDTWSWIDCDQRRGPACLRCLLAHAGGLPDNNSRASHLRGLVALQEHCCLRSRQDGRMGADQLRHGYRPLGLRSHHHLELSSVRSAQSGRSSAVGDTLRSCGVEWGAWDGGWRAVAVEASFV